MVMVQVPFAMAAALAAVIALDAASGSCHPTFESVVIPQGAAPTSQSGAPVSEPRISVAERDGVYHVTAEFTVPAVPGTVASVLTDYERIPDFMPDVKTSQVLERTETGLVVEQEAAATFLMFTRRIHLVLDVSHDGNTITFRDRCGKSFAKYEGAWRLAAAGKQTIVVYELSAKPLFDVPGFVLKRLFKRDAEMLIERLTAEITRRGNADSPGRPE